MSKSGSENEGILPKEERTSESKEIVLWQPIDGWNKKGKNEVEYTDLTSHQQPWLNKPWWVLACSKSRFHSSLAVSYTHLDVYKRQIQTIIYGDYYFCFIF